MKNFYFTFPITNPLKDAYMVVGAEDSSDAIKKMNDMYPAGFWVVIHSTLPLPAFRSTKSKLYEVPFGYMPESM